MTDLVDTTEMYLRTILDLEEEGIVPLRARISERLGHSGPTVSQTIGRMERDGLVVVEGDRHLELTTEGRTWVMTVIFLAELAELADMAGRDKDPAQKPENVVSLPRKRLPGEPATDTYAAIDAFAKSFA